MSKKTSQPTEDTSAVERIQDWIFDSADQIAGAMEEDSPGGEDITRLEAVPIGFNSVVNAVRQIRHFDEFVRELADLDDDEIQYLDQRFRLRMEVKDGESQKAALVKAMAKKVHQITLLHAGLIKDVKEFRALKRAA